MYKIQQAQLCHGSIPKQFTISSLFHPCCQCSIPNEVHLPPLVVVRAYVRACVYAYVCVPQIMSFVLNHHPLLLVCVCVCVCVCVRACVRACLRSCSSLRMGCCPSTMGSRTPSPSSRQTGSCSGPPSTTMCCRASVGLVPLLWVLCPFSESGTHSVGLVPLQKNWYPQNGSGPP